MAGARLFAWNSVQGTYIAAAGPPRDLLGPCSVASSSQMAFRGILVREADPFVEDIFFDLIDARGLPDPLPGAQ